MTTPNDSVSALAEALLSQGDYQPYMASSEWTQQERAEEHAADILAALPPGWALVPTCPSCGVAEPGLHRPECPELPGFYESRPTSPSVVSPPATHFDYLDACPHGRFRSTTHCPECEPVSEPQTVASREWSSETLSSDGEPTQDGQQFAFDLAIEKAEALAIAEARINQPPPIREALTNYFLALDGTRNTNDPEEQASFGTGVDYYERQLRALLTSPSGSTEVEKS